MLDNGGTVSGATAAHAPCVRRRLPSIRSPSNSLFLFGFFSHDTQTSAQGSIEYPASTIITYCSLLITL